MNDELKQYIYKLISKLLPDVEQIEVRAYVNDYSYSVEFWVIVDGDRMQCFEMVDKGMLKESDVKSVNQSIAKFIRNSSTYKKGKLNKINLIIKK